MLLKLAWRLGWVRYVSVLGDGNSWVRKSTIKDLLELEAPVELDGRLMMPDLLGTQGGYFIVFP